MGELDLTQLDIVSRATVMMIEGIFKENDFDIQYKYAIILLEYVAKAEFGPLTISFRGVESTDWLPVRRLPTMWDALKAAKARMSQQVDQLIARLARCWNLASSIHQLPVEVLVMIFQEFQPSSPHLDGSNSFFNLLLVCRTWYEAITGSPELWCSYDVRMPYNIGRLVINRSKALPLSVNWGAVHTLGYGSEGRGLDKLLDLGIENSMRIKSFDGCVSDSHYPDLRKLLEAPTPVLETLRVQMNGYSIFPGSNRLPTPFELSEGTQLKYLSLFHAIGPLDSPRLSNLITLDLRGFSVPQSLELLLGVLSSSQRLEVLQIRANPDNTEGYRANALVVLPHLKELVLSDVPSVYGAALLASVYIPSCFHVEVKDRGHGSFNQVSEAVKALDAEIWRPGNNQAAALVGGTSSNIIPGLLDISIDGSRIRVESLEPVRGRCKLEFSRPDTPELAARLGTTFSQFPSPPTVRLWLMYANPNGHSPVDLQPWSELLESLSAKGRSRCRSVLQQLSERYVRPGSGRVDWACRRLSRIELVYMPGDEEDMVLDGEALLSLVRHRWSGEGGLEEAIRLASFKVYCWKVIFPNLWSLEGDITRILPSFELVESWK